MVNVPLAYSAAFFAGSPDLRSFDNPVMPRNLKLSQRAAGPKKESWDAGAMQFWQGFCI
jgi:hypothetical protein